MKSLARIGGALLAALVMIIALAVIGLNAQQAPAKVQPPAQTVVPPVAPAAPAAPALSDYDSLLVRLVQLSDQLAACQQQVGSKNVVDLSQQVLARIEQQHPGYTVDWQTGRLIPKPAPAAAPPATPRK